MHLKKWLSHRTIAASCFWQDPSLPPLLLVRRPHLCDEMRSFREANVAMATVPKFQTERGALGSRLRSCVSESLSIAECKAAEQLTQRQRPSANHFFAVDESYRPLGGLRAEFEESESRYSEKEKIAAPRGRVRREVEKDCLSTERMFGNYSRREGCCFTYQKGAVSSRAFLLTAPAKDLLPRV